jgi:hypothetical protein
MKGTVILVVFFSTFTAASILLPSPMFPGNVLCTMLGDSVKEYTIYLSAVFNGVFYGAIMWLAFVAISRRLVQE